MSTVTPTDASWGIAEESTYGVRVAPSRFYPLYSLSFDYKNDRLESEATIAGLDIIGSDQWASGPITVGAELGFELYRDHIGLLLKHMFGSVSSSGSVHTFTPGAIDDISLCTHIDTAPVNAEALIPVEILGGKVTEWELSCTADEIVTGSITLAAADMHMGTRTVTDGVTNHVTNTTTFTSSTAAFSQGDVGKLISATGIPSGTTIAAVASGSSVTLSAAATATATGLSTVIGAPLATPSYGTLAATPFTFADCTFTIGGFPFAVNEVTIKGSNGLNTDRRRVGSRLMREPLRESRREYTVELGREYESVAMDLLLKAGAEVAVVTTFAAGSTSLAITANCRVDEANTSISPNSLAEEPLVLKVVRPSTTNASAITAVLTSASATV